MEKGLHTVVAHQVLGEGGPRSLPEAHWADLMEGLHNWEHLGVEEDLAVVAHHNLGALVGQEEACQLALVAVAFLLVEVVLPLVGPFHVAVEGHCNHLVAVEVREEAFHLEACLSAPAGASLAVPVVAFLLGHPGAWVHPVVRQVALQHQAGWDCSQTA